MKTSGISTEYSAYSSIKREKQLKLIFKKMWYLLKTIQAV